MNPILGAILSTVGAGIVLFIIKTFDTEFNNQALITVLLLMILFNTYLILYKKDKS